MLPIPGVKVELLKDGEIVAVAEDGEVGGLAPGRAIIRLTVAEHMDNSVLVFTVDGSKYVDPLKPKDEAVGFYDRNVNLFLSGAGFTYTRYPDNNVRVAAVLPDGSVDIYQVSLTSQEGSCYLVTDRQYTDVFYVGEDGQPVSPALMNRWPQAEQLIRDFIRLSGAELAPVSECGIPIGEVADDVEGFPQNRGRVLWWDTASGMGMIRTPQDGLVRAHWSKVSRGEYGRAFLIPGEVVQFQRLEPVPESPVGRKSAVRFQALGIEPYKAIATLGEVAAR